MQLFVNIIYKRLAIVVLVTSVTSEEELKCKARAGCHVWSCDPEHIPSIENLDRKEFPITCQTTSQPTTESGSQAPGSSAMFLQILMRFSNDTYNLEKGKPSLPNDRDNDVILGIFQKLIVSRSKRLGTCCKLNPTWNVQ